jgi:hypothetical protein
MKPAGEAQSSGLGQARRVSVFLVNLLGVQVTARAFSIGPSMTGGAGRSHLGDQLTAPIGPV